MKAAARDRRDLDVLHQHQPDIIGRTATFSTS